jgi:dipeptidyl aminopeptidase/acylaminoacyl peptidase
MIGRDESRLYRLARICRGDIYGALHRSSDKEVFMRKRLCIVLLLSFSLFCEAKEVKQYTIEQFLNTINYGVISFSHDDSRILVSANQTGIYNVYAIPIAGGPPVPLTHSDKENLQAVSYFPKDDRLLYSHDQGGNENSHLYVLTDGTEKDLTPGEKTKAIFLGWSQDQNSFYFLTNERDARFFDLYKINLPDFKRTTLFQNDTGYDVVDISRDEKYVALGKTITNHNSDMYLYNLLTKQMKYLTPHEGDILIQPQEFDPTSRFLYYLTNEESEFSYAKRYDLSSGKSEIVEKQKWDITTTYLSWNGKFRVSTANEDARTVIRVYDQSTGKQIELPQLPNGDITEVRISRNEKWMGFYFNGDRSPNDLYVYNFETKAIKKLTSSLSPDIDPSDLVDGEVVRYRSFDKMEIPSILWKPHQADENHKAPALVYVHGGPGDQTTKGYSASKQFLVNHGYVLLGVNNRGSSGYGKTFYKADDGKHGYEPLWDCVEAKKYLASLPYVDPTKIGIMGGSYGGYMVLAALTLKPEEFRVGVDLYGISNWVRTLESIPPYWESFRKALYVEIGDPVKDKEKLYAVSPLFHADKIVRPLMVIQGANDPRVIKPESDTIVEAVRKKNGIVEYLVFDDEGHGIFKKKNQAKAYQAILEFLNKYLQS